MPNFLGIEYKGQDEVLARRDMKMRAVMLICNLANAYPLSASRGNRIGVADEDAGSFPLVQGLIIGLQNIAIEPQCQQIFTTAKGCTAKPRDVIGAYQQNTFYDFIVAAGSVVCVGSYLEAAWAWAVQIIKANRATFPSGTYVHRTIAYVEDQERRWRARFA
jgi:hypothetical protein